MVSGMASLTPPVVPAGTLASSAQPEITGDGVLLRPWHQTDLSTVVAAYSDPAIQHWHFRTMDEEEAAELAHQASPSDSVVRKPSPPLETVTAASSASARL